VQYVHWLDPSVPDDGAQERTSLHASGSRKRPRGAALAAELVARELSLACHHEHGTQTFAVDDIGLANLAQSVEHLVRQLSTFESLLELPVDKSLNALEPIQFAHRHGHLGIRIMANLPDRKDGQRRVDHAESRTHTSTSTAFEVSSKRRKGFPSESQVKRGDRVVRGNKELLEKLGRNDLCPCGSGPVPIRRRCLGGSLWESGWQLTPKRNGGPISGNSPSEALAGRYSSIVRQI
jgi:hypothetical protein